MSGYLLKTDRSSRGRISLPAILQSLRLNLLRKTKSPLGYTNDVDPEKHKEQSIFLHPDLFEIKQS